VREDVDDVEGHFAAAVAHEGLVAVAHAAVVDYQDGVPVSSFVPEVERLALPGGFEATKAHDELMGGFRNLSW